MKEVEDILVKNPGFIAKGKPKKDAVLVITGLARSGTTHVAESLLRYIHLYYDESHNNLEDYELSEPIELGGSGLTKAKEIIAARGDRWAFKRPGIFRINSRLEDLFGSRLAYVVVFRDMLTCAIRRKLDADKRGDNQNVADSLKSTASAHSGMVDFVFNNMRTKSMFLVSYEKFASHNVYMKRKIRDWLNGE